MPGVVERRGLGGPEDQVRCVVQVGPHAVEVVFSSGDVEGLSLTETLDLAYKKAQEQIKKGDRHV